MQVAQFQRITMLPLRVTVTTKRRFYCSFNVLQCVTVIFYKSLSLSIMVFYSRYMRAFAVCIFTYLLLDHLET